MGKREGQVWDLTGCQAIEEAILPLSSWGGLDPVWEGGPLHLPRERIQAMASLLSLSLPCSLHPS